MSVKVNVVVKTVEEEKEFQTPIYLKECQANEDGWYRNSFTKITDTEIVTIVKEFWGDGEVSFTISTENISEISYFGLKLMLEKHQSTDIEFGATVRDLGSFIINKIGEFF